VTVKQQFLVVRIVRARVRISAEEVCRLRQTLSSSSACHPSLTFVFGAQSRRLALNRRRGASPARRQLQAPFFATVKGANRPTTPAPHYSQNTPPQKKITTAKIQKESHYSQKSHYSQITKKSLQPRYKKKVTTAKKNTKNTTAKIQKESHYSQKKSLQQKKGPKCIKKTSLSRNLFSCLQNAGFLLIIGFKF